MSFFYVLDGHEPRLCEDLQAWALFMADEETRIVSKSGFDDYRVSTVFIGLHHGMSPARPLLFETLVFDGQDDIVEGTMRRAATWDEALQNHDLAEAHVREVLEIARQAWKP